MLTRENEYWKPEPLWSGETVFCLASGPSLTHDVADRIKGRKTIVVNSSYVLAPWADVLYFTDSGWYELRRDIVAEWPGLVISMSRTAKRELPDKVRRVKGMMMPTFPAIGHEEIRQGRSSGHTAVSLAVALGAAKIILLGYDMRIVHGREHHHGQREAGYGGARDLDQYARDFVPAFNGWHADAQKVGCEILNATPGSAIQEFPFVDLDRLLQ